MAPRQEPPSDNDPREMIRRAGRQAADELLSEAFERMDQDDRSDSQAGLDQGSFGGGSAGYNSSAWFNSTSGPLTDSGLPDDSQEPTLADPAADLGPNLSAPSTSRAGAISRSTLISTPRFRPTRRPPMAVLRVWDDGLGDAEAIRIRQTPFLIGRQEGSLVIGHERQMSRKHARIDRVQQGDTWRWRLTDLRSTNGTFFRVDQATLTDGVEVLVGGELVRFHESPAGAPPELSRVAPKEDEERVRLIGASHFIGTDAEKCLPFLLSSPHLDPQNFRVEMSGGTWRIHDLASTNHLWAMIEGKRELNDGQMFQIGEQRFSFHLP